MITVGSKIRCIDNMAASNLVVGQIYEVEKISNNKFFYLVGFSCGYAPFNSSRFEEIVETLVGRKVRCLDNDEVEDVLTVGNIYEIEEVASNGNYHLKDVSNWFMPSRFELVDETSVIAMSQPKSTTTDVEEDNIWQKWVAPLPGHCKCGMLRAQCQYHKS